MKNKKSYDLILVFPLIGVVAIFFGTMALIGALITHENTYLRWYLILFMGGAVTGLFPLIFSMVLRELLDSNK
jgi:hypothetical protein